MILVAAFEPFGGRRRNRAERAVRRLAGTPGLELASLPVAFARLPGALDALLARRPAVLLLCGEARQVRGLCVERVALNLADARIADNDGAQPRGLVLEPRGPLARQVAFPVETAVEAIEARGVPACASAHAGTFCCNAALYHALGAAGPETLVAFVHLPARRRHLHAGRAAVGLRALLASLVAVQGSGQGGEPPDSI